MTNVSVAALFFLTFTKTDVSFTLGNIFILFSGIKKFFYCPFKVFVYANMEAVTVYYSIVFWLRSCGKQIIVNKLLLVQNQFFFF